MWYVLMYANLFTSYCALFILLILNCWLCGWLLCYIFYLDLIVIQPGIHYFSFKLSVGLMFLGYDFIWFVLLYLITLPKIVLIWCIFLDFIHFKSKISVGADGSPHSWVCACLILCSAPHRHQWKFVHAHVCKVTLKSIFSPFQANLRTFRLKNSITYKIAQNLFLGVKTPMQNFRTLGQPLPREK